jgi:hypothetical protein
MRQISICMLLTFIYAYSYGQVYVGLSSGVAITKIRIEEGTENFNRPESKTLPGFNMDVPILFKFNKHISLQSGLSYLNMGATLAMNNSYRVIDVSDPIYQSLRYNDAKYRLNYLSVPITFNYTIPLKYLSVYARAGGYISTLLYGTSKEEDRNSKRTINLNDEKLNSLDFGSVAGIGITRDLGKGFLFMDAKYMIGLSNLNDSADSFAVPYGNNKLYNRGGFFNIGYMLNLGKAQ